MYHHLLERPPQPYCDDCVFPQTVQHIFLECPSPEDLCACYLSHYRDGWDCYCLCLVLRMDFCTPTLELSGRGLTFTEKWNTENILNTEVALEDKIAKGLKLVLNTSFAPQTGKKSGVLKSTYKSDGICVNLDSTLDLGGPVINGACVGSYKNWLLGYQMSFDSAKSKLIKNNFAVGFTNPDFILHTYANDGAEFGGSLYHKINRDLEGAVDLAWSAGSNTTRFSIGCKYILEKDAFLRAKINNSSQVGIGYQQKVRDGINLTLSTLIDGKNFQQGGHKIGLALEFEA